MEHLNIQHCEEPINRKHYQFLPEIKKSTTIPIMADESCCDVNDAEHLEDIDAVDKYNLKLGKSGGMFHAEKLVSFATQRKRPIQMGGFLESRLGMSAFAHFAQAFPIIQYYDFDTCLMFTEDPIEGGIEYRRGGLIKLNDEPGIGAKPKVW